MGGGLGDDGEGGEEVDDDLYQDAVRVCCEMGRASTSTLQRRLRIGYGRAARLIDIMEKDGIVGPADGAKPREVLKNQRLDERIRRLREVRTRSGSGACFTGAICSDRHRSGLVHDFLFSGFHFPLLCVSMPPWQIASGAFPFPLQRLFRRIFCCAGAEVAHR